jgi:putative iron-only hydrogenase system regulator
VKLEAEGSHISAVVLSLFSHFRENLYPFACRRDFFMEKTVAIIAIIVEDKTITPDLNALLSEYGDFIIGRMGLPYRERKINIISVVLDAPQDAINALFGKIGRLKGVTAKTLYGKFSATLSGPQS